MHKGGQKKGVGAYTPNGNPIAGSARSTFPFLLCILRALSSAWHTFPLSVDGICKVRFVIATFLLFRRGLHWVKVDEKAERTGKSSRRAASVGTAATSACLPSPLKDFYRLNSLELLPRNDRVLFARTPFPFQAGLTGPTQRQCPPFPLS